MFWWFRADSDNKPRAKGGRPRGSKTRPASERLEAMKVKELRRLEREDTAAYRRAMLVELGLADAPVVPKDDLAAMLQDLGQLRAAGRSSTGGDAEPTRGRGSSNGISRILGPGLVLAITPLLAQYAPQLIQYLTRGLATAGGPVADQSPRPSSATSPPVASHVMDEAELEAIAQRFKEARYRLKLSPTDPPPPDAEAIASAPSGPVVAAEPADLSAPIIAELEGRDPEQAADWLRTNGALWTWVLVPELQQTPDAERPARLAELGIAYPSYHQLAEWLLAQPDWLQATVDRLRSQHAP